MTELEPRRGPPPLAPFGLLLHHDGTWTHDGEPVTNRKLRERFDRAVRFVPEEGKYVVQIAHFRGEIEIEEAGFFVRCFDDQSGAVTLSDGSEERLDASSLRVSKIDGALLCTVKHELVPAGLAARFHHAAHSALMNAVADDASHLLIGGQLWPLPDLSNG